MFHWWESSALESSVVHIVNIVGENELSNAQPDVTINTLHCEEGDLRVMSSTGFQTTHSALCQGQKI